MGLSDATRSSLLPSGPTRARRFVGREHLGHRTADPCTNRGQTFYSVPPRPSDVAVYSTEVEQNLLSKVRTDKRDREGRGQ